VDGFKVLLDFCLCLKFNLIGLMLGWIERGHEFNLVYKFFGVKMSSNLSPILQRQEFVITTLNLAQRQELVTDDK
jgi:hypothetical protein